MARKSQQERSTEMRTRLMEATLDCLESWGYHGASLSRILESAGVSRGAWHHHYASKHDLVASAAEYALNRVVETTQRLALKDPPLELDLNRLFDFIWDNFYTGRHKAVWLEFNIACRTDAALRQRLKPILDHFHTAIETAWNSHFAASDLTNIPIETFLELSINTLRGMAVQSIIQDDQAYYRNLRSQWVRIIAPLVIAKKRALHRRSHCRV